MEEPLCLEETILEVDEVKCLARNIDLTKASCIGHVSTKICKDVLMILPDKFCKLFNISLHYSIFLRLCSVGYVNVIPKDGNLNKPGNWRPITQTNVYAKVLEKIVHKRLITHILENNILSKYQFGFLPGKSTQFKNIYSSINNKKIFGAACLDISKAFDCINHRLLLAKLRNLGLSDSTINWFSSYLDRTQELSYDGQTSSCIRVKSGIGQGTIIGPIVFLIYINNIVNMLPNVHINMYVDDCILYCTGNNWPNVRECLQEGLIGFDTWCRTYNMVLNVSKSKCLVISSRSKLSRIDYGQCLCVRNIFLEYVKKFCYLGVYLDSEMSLTPLILHGKKVVSNRAKILSKIRKYINSRCAVSIYKQTILPLLDYSGFLLMSCNKSDPHDLQIIENNILRTSYNVRLVDRLSIVDMHREASLISLEQRRKIQLLSCTCIRILQM